MNKTRSSAVLRTAYGVLSLDHMVVCGGGPRCRYRVYLIPFAVPSARNSHSNGRCGGVNGGGAIVPLRTWHMETESSDPRRVAAGKDETIAALKIHMCVRGAVTVLRAAIREAEKDMFGPSAQKKRKTETVTQAPIAAPMDRSDVAELYMMTKVLDGLPNGLNMKSSFAENEQFHVPVYVAPSKALREKCQEEGAP